MLQKARSYKIINGELYKLGVVAPYLKCVDSPTGTQLLKEIHNGHCGIHLGSRALVSKAFRQGFFWPNAIADAINVVKTCQICQKFSKSITSPSQDIKLTAPTWPLQKWGIDIVGPLPTAQGNYKYTVVAIEYFTKWIEAKPLVSITSVSIQKFFWQNIICRFGVPQEVVVDNGRQFDSDVFKQYCHSIGNKVSFASAYHPQSNGACERANGLVFSGVKKRLFEISKGKWVEELPGVIWHLNTTESRSTKFTPFKLMYGAEAMTLEELKHKGPRSIDGVQFEHDEAAAKDIVEVYREEALKNFTKYQAETKNWRDKKRSKETLKLATSSYFATQEPNRAVNWSQNGKDPMSSTASQDQELIG
jgi:hypothetical protein